MEFIQEPSCCQESNVWHGQSREEEYKVVLDFSFYCVIDGSLYPWFIIILIHHINLAGSLARGNELRIWRIYGPGVVLIKSNMSVILVLVNCMIYSSTQVMDIGLLITDLVSEYVSNLNSVKLGLWWHQDLVGTGCWRVASWSGYEDTFITTR